jgi:hypothetical protein
VAAVIRDALWAAGVLLVGCAGAAPRAETPPPAPTCDELRGGADRASRALDACRAASPAAAWAHGEAFDWLDERVGARLSAEREGAPIALTAAEAQEIAERVWALLDEVEDEVPEGERALRDRTEDAAEALLREHQEAEQRRALAGLGTALGALRAAIEPAPAGGCDREERDSAAAWMSVQASCSDAAP